MSDNHKLLDSYLTMINERLSEYIPDDGSELSQAMRYSLLCGGKRVRPVITLAFAECAVKKKASLYLLLALLRWFTPIP